MEEDETQMFQQGKERQFMEESRRNRRVSVTERSELEDARRSAVGTRVSQALDSQGQIESQRDGRAPAEHQVITDSHN